jgi:hypothetical protein
MSSRTRTWKTSDELKDKDKGTGKGEDKGTGKGEDKGTGKGAGKDKGTSDLPWPLDKGTGKGEGKDKGTGKGEDEGTGKGEDKGTGKGAGKDKGTGRATQTKGKGKSWWSVYLQVKTARTHALMLEDELQKIEDELEAMPYI